MKEPTNIHQPIIAYTPFGLANRLLGMASTMAVCNLLDRPMILAWERNAHIGQTCYSELFSTEITLISHRPDVAHVVEGTKYQTEYFFPKPKTLLICHDICNFNGVNEDSVHYHIKTLKLKDEIQRHLDNFISRNDMSNVVGVHFRQGDKWKSRFKKRLDQVDNHFKELIKEIIHKTNYYIYLSCDNLATFYTYKKLHGNRIISSEKSVAPLRRTPQSIKEALVDFYILSKTRHIFYGIGTFGYGASILGGCSKTNILSPKSFFFEFSDIGNCPFCDIQSLLVEL